MKNTLISFVVPCYRCRTTIEMVVDEIIATVGQRAGYSYEIVLVNDCSPDDSLELLKALAQKNKNIKVVSLAKNMGKHAAVLAGYAVAAGDYVVDLDDDYQSPVNEFWKLFKPVESGECDYATAKYFVKKEPLWKRFGSDLNLFMSAALLDKPSDLRFENFSVMKRFVAKKMTEYRHPYPYLEGLVLRITRRIQTVEMHQRERAGGATTFTFSKCLSLWANGLTAFSVRPLRMAFALGVSIGTSGFVFAGYIIARRLLDPNIAAGFSSIMATILVMSGIIMILIGLIGEYLGRVYICINNSPQYVIRETYNIAPEDLREEAA